MPPKRQSSTASKASTKRRAKKKVCGPCLSNTIQADSESESEEENSVSEHSSEEEVKTSKQEAEEESDDEMDNNGDPFDASNARTLALKAKFDLEWKKCGTLYYLDSPQIKGSSKVIGFDMDSTLVVPKGKGFLQIIFNIF